MDTIRDPKLTKRKPELGSEKPFRDNSVKVTEKDDHSSDSLEWEGQTYKMPEDMKALPEINYNDPAVKKWLQDEESERLNKYGKLSSDEMEKLFELRQEIQGKNPDWTAEQITRQAWSELKSACEE